MRREICGVKTDPAGVVDEITHTQVLEQADRHHIARFGQRPAQARGPVETAAVVLGSPGAFQRGIFKGDRRIVDDAGGGKACVEGSGVEERLEIRSRLTLGLGRAVEFTAFETDSADQADDGSVFGVQGNQCRLGLGHLCELPVSFIDGRGTDQIAHRKDLPRAQRCAIPAVLAQVGPNLL